MIYLHCKSDMEEINNIKKNKKRLPWVVWYIVIIAIAQYILINYKDTISFVDANIFILLGAPGSVEIYNGQYWGVLTNNFLHIYLSQLVLNIIGVSIFGYIIEKRIGFIRFSFIIVLASIVPSIIQLNLTNQPGIGLSSVNFTLFGYILIKGFQDKDFRIKYVQLFLAIMIGVIVYCQIYNLYFEDVYRTEAMTFGFLLGLFIGYLSKFKIWIQSIVLFNIIAFCISSLFYAPWSSEWQLYKGVSAHKAKQYKNAKKYYKKSLDINPKNQQSINNINLLKIDELKWKAYKAHVKEQYKLARKLYEEILDIDPTDEWAIEGYNELP